MGAPMITDIPGWAALLGVATPLVALAGSAVAYVLQLYRDAAEKKRTAFFDLMAIIDDKERPIASKMAAVYELRHFKAHKDFIVRFCKVQQTNISGPSANILRDEMRLTEEYLSKR
jgi:hypothetical protein